MSQSQLFSKLMVPASARITQARTPHVRRALNRCVGVFLPLFLLAAWQLASVRGWAPQQLLPPPADVRDTLVAQISSGELLTSFAISMARVVGGFALGGAMGLAVGLLMGLSPRFEQYLAPSFQVVSQVPVLGWLPFAMMIFGIGETLKIVIIAHATLVPMAINTLKGIRNVPHQYIEVARAFRFSNTQLLRQVILPAAVPTMFVGVRYALTAAWLSLVTVELLASSEGLGFLIVWGRQLFQLDVVLAAIIVVGVVGLLLDTGLAVLEKHLLRWRPEAL